MENFASIMNEYIKSELLVLVPVLYIIAKYLDSSKVKKQSIPLILLAISVVLAGIYTFATVDTSNIHKVLMAIFSTIVQGVLLSGSAIFSGILVLTMNKNKTSEPPK